MTNNTQTLTSSPAIADEVATLDAMLATQPVCDRADTDNAATRIKVARDIGAAESKVERLTADTAATVIAGLPAEFDPKARGAITGAVHAYFTNDGEVDQPPVASGPKGEQTATNYGRGVNNVVKAIRKALASEPTLPDVASITVTLGKSATAPGQTMTFTPDADGYADLLAMLAGSADES